MYELGKISSGICRFYNIDPDKTNSQGKAYQEYYSDLAQVILDNKAKSVEEISREICIFEKVDPDKESVGLGRLIPKDQPYKLWEARIKMVTELKGMI